MYLFLFVYICIVTGDYLSIVIPTSDGNEYLGINGYANPCDNQFSRGDDIYTQLYNRYSRELCNNGQNISIICNVATNLGYLPCSNHFYNNCSENNNYTNDSWIGKIKYLSKYNYTYCQNNKYRFVLTHSNIINNKINKNMLIDPNLNIYIFIGYAALTGIFLGIFLSIIFFG